MGLPASHGFFLEVFFSLNTYIKPECFQRFLKAEIKVQDPYVLQEEMLAEREPGLPGWTPKSMRWETDGERKGGGNRKHNLLF